MNKKLMLVFIVILVTLLLPTMALAQETESIEPSTKVTTQESVAPDTVGTTAQDPIGSITYQALLDLEDVKEIKFVKGPEINAMTAPNSPSTINFNENAVLYVLDTLRVEDNIHTLDINENDIVWVQCRVDESSVIYYIDANNTEYKSSVDSGYKDPTTIIKKEVKKSLSNNTNVSEEPIKSAQHEEIESSGNSKSVRITAYCSACNTPKGSTQTASDTPAYIGSCAIKGVPLHTMVNVEGYGTFEVLDRPGNNVIDIWTGESDSCTCREAGYSGTVTVTW